MVLGADATAATTSAQTPVPAAPAPTVVVVPPTMTKTVWALLGFGVLAAGYGLWQVKKTS